MASKYTDEQKRQVVEFSATHGLAATSRHFEISKTQIAGWAKAAGVTYSSKQTEAANNEWRAKIEKRRKRVRGKLLRVVELAADRNIEILQTIGIGKAEAQTVRDIAVAGAVSLDKFRLESGEPTTREAHLDEGGASKEVETAIDELAEKRRKRA